MTDSDDWRSRPPSDGPEPGDGTPPPSGTPSDGAPQYGESPQYGDTPHYGDVPPPETPQYGAPPPGSPQYGTPQYGTPPPGTPQYGTPQYGTPQYGAGPAYGSTPYPGGFADAGGPPMTVLPKPPSLGDGLKWAWNRYTANAGSIIGAAVVWAVIFIVITLVLVMIVSAAVFAIAGAADSLSGTVSVGASVSLTAVMTIMLVLVGAVALSCWLNGVITIADGRQAEFSDFFRVRALGPILAISIVLGLISALAEVAFNYGLGLPWASTIVSIVIGLLTMWMVYIAADQLTDVGTAMSQGLNLSTENLGATIVVYLISVLLSIVGFLLLLVGLLVTLPLSSLLMLYYLRSLTQRPIVADAAPAY